MATSVSQIDDDRLRVIRWTFSGAGDAIGQHRHEFDYLVVPLTDGTYRSVFLDGTEKTIAQVAGEPYLGKEGTEHDVISASEGETSFVEIEFKRS